MKRSFRICCKREGDGGRFNFTEHLDEVRIGEGFLVEVASRFQRGSGSDLLWRQHQKDASDTVQGMKRKKNCVS